MKINNIVFKEYQAKDFQDYAMVVCVDFVKELFATKANEWWSDNVAVIAGSLAPETLVYAYKDYMALKKAAQQRVQLTDGGLAKSEGEFNTAIGN